MISLSQRVGFSTMYQIKRFAIRADGKSFTKGVNYFWIKGAGWTSARMKVSGGYKRFWDEY
jgi:hypothetical protein